tara:strand:+ start:344 stop:517 length:174 start_codon:yes stop_codon:yes gene_type:complete
MCIVAFKIWEIGLHLKYACKRAFILKLPKDQSGGGIRKVKLNFHKFFNSGLQNLSFN